MKYNQLNKQMYIYPDNPEIPSLILPPTCLTRKIQDIRNIKSILNLQNDMT